MKYAVKINNVKTVDELENSWNDADFTELLIRFGYADAAKVKQNELKEYLFLAITDYEPAEAAAIVLDYKLSEVLTKGQTDHLSQEMVRDKVAENHSDIYVHKVLFNANQLLYKAYNGKFPLTKANVVAFGIKAEHEEETSLTKELVLKALRISLSESSLLNRLFKEQLDGNAPFPEAEGIIWDLYNKGNAQYVLTTSEKWFKEEDFENLEFECLVSPYVEKPDVE